jgi:hypothetical protein
MPPESPWPLVLTLALAIVFSFLLVGHYVVAAGGAVLALLALAGWHSQPPRETA